MPNLHRFLRTALLGIAACVGFEPCTDAPVDASPPVVGIEPELLHCPAEDVVRSATTPPFLICVFGRARRDLISETIRATGLWEPALTARATRVLEAVRASDGGGAAAPSSVVVDVGAHLGWFTLLAAARGFDVVALEPLAPQRARLAASLRLNGFERRVTLFAFAASSAAFAAPMWSGATNTGGAWLKPAAWDDAFAARFDGAAPPADGALARAARLDDVLAAAAAAAAAPGAPPPPPRAIALAKLDVEGHVGRALAGAPRALARAAHLLLEVVPNVEAAHGCDAGRMLHGLHGLGYRLCVPERDAAGAGELCFAAPVEGVRTGNNATWQSVDYLLVHAERGVVPHMLETRTDAVTHCTGECAALRQGNPSP